MDFRKSIKRWNVATKYNSSHVYRASSKVLYGVEAFAIFIRGHCEVAMVTIIDDDVKFTILSVLHIPLFDSKS